MACSSPSMLDAFFSPRKVAVVGVSDRPGNLARNIVRNLLDWGFPGQIIPVGSSGGTVHGLQTLGSVEAIPDGVDLACVLTPAATVPGVIEELGSRGVAAVCIQSSGFNEFDEEGEVLASRVLQAAARHNTRIIGPNCLGTINTETRLCAPFVLMERFATGPVALVSQSGGVLLSYLRLLLASNIGLSKAVSFGNKLDVDEVDVIRHLAADPATRVICLYLEDIRRGRALLDAAAACDKPIVLFKSNRSGVSRTIASSHTASLLSDYGVVAAAARQCAIVTAERMAAALTAVKALLLPPLRGRRTAVVSRSGGHAVIAADACAANGLELVELPAGILERLRGRLRAGVIRLGNPLDVGDLWDVDVLEQIVSEIGALEVVDGMVFLYTPPYGDRAVPARLARHARQVSQATGKPIATCLEGVDLSQLLEPGSSWPLFSTVEEAVDGLAIQARYRETRAGVCAPCDDATAAAVASPPRFYAGSIDDHGERAHLPQRNGWLPWARLLPLLREHGVPMIDTRLARGPDEAARLAQAIGFPVAAKVLSPNAPHKTEIGGVCLDLASADSVRQACEQMAARLREEHPEAAIDGFAIQPMAPPGLEVIVGCRGDPGFGPVVLVGLGGKLVEVFRDVAVRVAPLDREGALRMLSDLAGYPLLAGVRDAAPLDREALALVVQQLSILAFNEQQTLAEIELNPVIVHEQGCSVVDARARRPRAGC